MNKIELQKKDIQNIKEFCRKVSDLIIEHEISIMSGTNIYLHLFESKNDDVYVGSTTYDGMELFMDLNALTDDEVKNLRMKKFGTF